MPPRYAPALPRGRVHALTVLTLVLTCLAWLTLFGHKPYTLDSDGLRAAETMRQGMRVLREFRDELGLPVDVTLDPADTGLIGEDYSDLTTTLGSLTAKQTSLNPGFAGLVTVWLKQAGLAPGDKVAVCLTGSFPALNLAALSACQALDLRPLIFSSVGASTYGANIPGFTWLDMERKLTDTGILHTRTRFASLGGIMDNHGGLDGTGYEQGEAAIQRHGALYVREHGEADLVNDIERRMRLYTEDEMPRAFLNVGGSVTALGWVSEAALLDNGLLTRTPSTSSPKRGTIFRMHELGVPVIHLLNIERLAVRYGLPLSPHPLPDEHNWERAWRLRLAVVALMMLLWWTGAVILIKAALLTNTR